MKGKLPTRRQYECLRLLADPGLLLVSGIRGEHRPVWKSLLAHGWVSPRDPDYAPENGLGITAEGLRALGDYVEVHWEAISMKEMG